MKSKIYCAIDATKLINQRTAMPQPVTLRQLRAFVTISRLGSFVEAARTLHVTPSALSIVVREFEAALGLRVFERTTRRVALNEAGRRYLPYAEQVLADLQRAERLAEDLRGGRTGVVRLASTALLGWAVLPQALAGFRAGWPSIRVELLDVPADGIVSAVETGLADLAINLSTPSARDIQATPLFHSRVHLVCPRGHRLARRRRVAWRELADEALIVIGKGAEMRLRADLPPDLPLPVRHEVSNTISAMALVAAGAGLAICSGYGRPATRLHGLAMPLLEAPVIDRRFLLYRAASSPDSGAAEALHGHLLRHFAARGDQPLDDGLPVP